MLRLKDVKAGYAGSMALHGVDLSLAKGEVLCLVGRNGAGKTSILRSIAQDVIQVVEGEVEFEGKSLRGLKPHMVVRHGIALVPEDRRVFASLSVQENLRVPQPHHGGAGRWTIQDVYALFPQLYSYRTRTAGVMSGGEQQMLAIGRSLLTDPRILLLDEPNEGLSPKVAEEVTDAINNLKNEGMAMIVAEQQVHTIARCADRVCVVDRGGIAFSGTADEFVADPSIARKYLMVL